MCFNTFKFHSSAAQWHKGRSNFLIVFYLCFLCLFYIISFIPTHNYSLCFSKLWLASGTEGDQTLTLPVAPFFKVWGKFIYNRCQGGRTWQPFVRSKNGNENFRQTRSYNFRVKCVVFARNRKFAKLTQ